MSLKAKILFIFLGVFLVYVAADAMVQQFVVLPSFRELERSEAQKDLERVVEAIKREIHHLTKLCWDWSAWDDTYEFIVSRSDGYIESNLPMTTFVDNGIQLIYFIDTSGNLVWGQIFDLKTKKPIELTAFPKTRFLKEHLLITHERPSKELSEVLIAGIVNTGKGPMLVAARPILTSENEGPSRGTLIMGRFLDEDLVKTLVDQSKVTFSILPLESGVMSDSEGGLHARFPTEAPYHFEKQGEDRLLVRTVFRDVEGKAALLITASVPRSISAKGYSTSRYALGTGVVSMLMVLAIMLFVLRQTILKPIVQLKNHALSIAKTGDLSARVSMRRQDEIGALGREFDRMMEKLEEGANCLKEVNDQLKRDMAKRIETEKALRESEASLARAKKMESLGLMAGGIAHDLNNILSGIVTYPELLLMDLPQDSPLRKPLTTIRESGMRAVEVVADLLTIARGVATTKLPLNLNRVVEEYLHSPEYRLLQQVHSVVNFKVDLDPHLLSVHGTALHIRKALMNLTANAAEAIEGGGTVTIATENRYLDEPLKGYEEVRPGEYVVLRISDTGVGISPEECERIFEPFYTKKVLGRSGTGLGLAVVWNTVQDHRGYIDVHSSIRGTSFELYFPMTRETADEALEEVSAEAFFSHGEKILVVDDEVQQREIACELLSRLGYVPEAAPSGEAAIEAVRKEAFDLLLLDMVMPRGMNGRETFQEILKIRPGQKALIASGYAQTAEVERAQQLGAGEYIKKPYTLEKIGRAIRRELEK